MIWFRLGSSSPSTMNTLRPFAPHSGLMMRAAHGRDEVPDVLLVARHQRSGPDLRREFVEIHLRRRTHEHRRVVDHGDTVRHQQLHRTPNLSCWPTVDPADPRSSRSAGTQHRACPGVCARPSSPSCDRRTPSGCRRLGLCRGVRARRSRRRARRSLRRPGRRTRPRGPSGPQPSRAGWSRTRRSRSPHD